MNKIVIKVTAAIAFVIAILIEVSNRVTGRLNFKGFTKKIVKAFVDGFVKGVIKSKVTVVTWEPRDSNPYKFTKPTYIDTIMDEKGNLCTIKHVYVWCKYDDLTELYELENGNYVSLMYMLFTDNKNHKTGDYWNRRTYTAEKLKEAYNCSCITFPHGINQLAPAAGIVQWQM